MPNSTGSKSFRYQRNSISKRSKKGRKKKRRDLQLHLEQLEDRRMLSVQDLSSFPAEFTEFDGSVIFSAQDDTGNELWKYNGSLPFRITDINSVGSSLPRDFTPVGNDLYFVASDGTPAADPIFTLWKNDGLSTTQVLDGSAVAPISPTDLIEVGSSLFFVASDGLNGRELWTTDGTSAGTRMVKDIFPDGVALDGPSELTNVDGILYFRAYDQANGWELWKSDGTELGTQIVADLFPGEEGSQPHELNPLGSSLYFVANNGVFGSELWRQSGVSAPELVKEINPNGSANIANLFDIDSDLFFFSLNESTLSTELWTSDGTEIGTEMLASLHPGQQWAPGEVIEVGGDLYFSLISPNIDEGWELWTSDGTPLGTQLVESFTTFGDWFDPFTVTSVGNELFFAAYDSTFGHELWKSDGTVGSATRVSDINPRVGNSQPGFLQEIDGNLFFTADDGSTGFEPYLYDTVTASVRQLANIETTLLGPDIQISLSFNSDTGFDDTDNLTSISAPVFFVDVNMAGLIEIDFDDDGIYEVTRTVENFGTQTFQPISPFTDGTHEVNARFTAEGSTVEDDTNVVIDTQGPTLLSGLPVEIPSVDFHTLLFDEPILSERIFEGFVTITGLGIPTPVPVNEFFSDFIGEQLDVSFDPLTTPGLYTLTISPLIQDLAGNTLDAASPREETFLVVADPVVIDDDSQITPWDPSYEGKDLIVENGGTLEVDGTHSVSSLWLLNGGRIISSAGNALNLQVTGDAFIDSSSSIDLNGLGHVGGSLSLAGNGPGAGTVGTDGGSGGGHGGTGGNGGSADEAAGGATNDSEPMPVFLGSGGGGSTASTGGDGGGALRLEVTGTLDLDGTISANGTVGTGSNASGGAGGSAWIIADTFEGNGTIEANGAASTGFGGGGGGGRIAISVTTSLYAGTLAALGGLGSSAIRTGLDGTISPQPASSIVAAAQGMTLESIVERRRKKAIRETAAVPSRRSLWSELVNRAKELRYVDGRVCRVVNGEVLGCVDREVKKEDAADHKKKKNRKKKRKKIERQGNLLFDVQTLPSNKHRHPRNSLTPGFCVLLSLPNLNSPQLSVGMAEATASHGRTL